jgi:putative DNA-invertase from lambdoid prophage Rac
MDTTRSQLIAAIYVRVSTADQRHAMQTSEVLDYAGRMGWQIAEYSDTMSGAKTRRPGLDRLMEDARLRKIDIVLVWKMDRFGRSLKDLIDNLLLLDNYGVRFISVTQGIDTDRRNPASKFMMQILAAVSEFERAIIVERVRAGVAEAKRQGKHCGRPAKIWRRDEAVRLRAEGFTFRAIGAKLGQSEAAIRKALKVAHKV